MPACPACERSVHPAATVCSSCGRPLDDESHPTRLASDGGEESQQRTGSTSSPTARAQQWGRIAMAVGFATLPAIGVYAMASLTTTVELLASLLALPVFAILIYRQRTTTRMTSATLFWLALEAFVAPVVVFVYIASSIGGSNDTAFGTALAGIQGGILLVLAFVVCIPLGIGFYVLSKRVQPATTNV